MKHSPVAQSVEQLTVNQWVTGSSPVRGASYLRLQNYLKITHWLLRALYNTAFNSFGPTKISNMLSVLTITSLSYYLINIIFGFHKKYYGI